MSRPQLHVTLIAAAMVGLSLASPAFCQAPGLSRGTEPGLEGSLFGWNGLTVRTGTGAMYGVSKEQVLYSATAFESELVWAVQPVFYVESSLELHALGGLALSLDVKNGIPGKSGFITDSDWMNLPLNNDKTHFSQHDCYTERAILMDARAGWDIPFGEAFILEPYAALGFMSFKWTARDGYLQYPPAGATAPYPAWSPTEEKIPAYGTGIVYEQTYLLPAAGLRFSARLLGRVEAAAYFSASPLSFLWDLDNHNFRLTDFYGAMRGGLLLEPGLSLRVTLSPRAAVSLDASYRSITRLVGDTYSITAGVNFPGTTQNPLPGTRSDTIRNAVGAEYGVLSGGLFLDIRL